QGGVVHDRSHAWTLPLALLHAGRRRPPFRSRHDLPLHDRVTNDVARRTRRTREKKWLCEFRVFRVRWYPAAYNPAVRHALTLAIVAAAAAGVLAADPLDRLAG